MANHQKIKVTIKFCPEKMWISRVYRIMYLLNAIKNETIINYGISNLYYYSHDAMAIYSCIKLDVIHGKGIVFQNLQPDSLVLCGSRILLTGLYNVSIKFINGI